MELTVDPKLVLQVYANSHILPAWDNFMAAKPDFEQYHMKYIHLIDATGGICSRVIFETEADKLDFLMTWS
jgi:hypothetical protein